MDLQRRVHPASNVLNAQTKLHPVCLRQYRPFCNRPRVTPNAAMRVINVGRRAFVAQASAATAQLYTAPGQHLSKANMVYKFGGSSVRDAERMREVADIVCSFQEYLPVIVLSAMGKTTNMLLECGDLSLHTPLEDVGSLPPLKALRALHLDTCDALGVEPAVRAEVEKLLGELQQLLVGISIMQDLTARAKDKLVSFGERMATRIFASFLRQQGVPARQWDAWELGLITSDEFSNAEVNYEQSLPRIKAALHVEGGRSEVHVVTGFLGQGVETGAITTLGRGGSDLTATVLGAALGLGEVQVWKDVDGVLTSDPRICSGPLPVCELTYEEATELAYFGAQVLHPLAMQPAIKSEGMAVRVKNSYNRTAPGTVITSRRNMQDVLVTSVVLKNDVTLFDIVSTRMLGQYGFLSSVFEVFRRNKVSVDVVATSEVSVSLTLDPRKLPSSKDTDLEALTRELSAFAQVSSRQKLAIVSLICNVTRTSEILAKTFSVLQHEGINVQMMSQGASKTNISLVINGSEGKQAVQALHRAFFEDKARPTVEKEPAFATNGRH